MKKGCFLLFLVFLSATLLRFPLVVGAEDNTSGLVETYKIADNEAVDGDLITNSSGSFVRAKVAYDSSLFGVLEDSPTLVFRSGVESNRPIVRTGVAMVNVTSENGTIKNGDYLTSSKTAGKAMKATNSGYVLGIALEDLTGKEGKIAAAIKIEYAELAAPRSANRLLEYLGGSLLANAKDPEKFGQVVRYFAAGLVLLAGFGFGFLTFSKSLPKGIEAIGRNPLAKNTIYFSMALNVGLIAIVGILGIAGALLILRL